MSQKPEDRDDDLDAALRRMETEFGRRPPPEGAEPAAPPRVGPPGFASVEPPGPPPAQPFPVQEPAPRQVRIWFPTSRPRVIWAIIAVNVLMYLLSAFLSGSLFQPSLVVLAFLGAKVNPLIADGELWRLVGAMFLHGNLVHIFFNGYGLYALGPESERLYGTARFLAVYFLAGIGGSVASYLFSPVPSVGASGAIFGLIGALGLFFYLNRRVLGQAGQAQVQSLVTIALINLFIGFSSPGVIDNFGHLGGLVAGLLAALALAPRLTVVMEGYQPKGARSFPSWGWPAAAALGAVLLALAWLLPGAR
jgi:rhomboid protease GluP